MGLKPAKKGQEEKNGVGFTFVPEPEVGEGYLWTYPINAACSLTIYDVVFHQDTTIYEFILACRIDRAKELLADREKKLSEIAALVGYERQSSFSAAFHQKTGITPNEFRRQFWNK